MSRKTRVLSPASAAILRRFLSAPTDELHGFRIINEAGIPSSTLYPALRLLAEKRSFLTWRWEDIDPRVEKRPPRRLYRLRGESASAARKALSEYEAHQEKQPLSLRPQPHGGRA